MLANLKFGDFMTRLYGGILPQTMAAGTTSGSAIALGGSANVRKMAFRVLAAKGTANSTVTLQLATATASNGTFASLSAAVASVSISAASLYELILDTRDEWFCDLGTTTTWVQPQIVVATTATPLALDVLGYNVGSEPASNGNAAAIVVTETDLF